MVNRCAYQRSTAVSLVVLVLFAMIDRRALPVEPEKPPNIVFVLADDLGWNDVGYHNQRIRTPHIDALAESGVQLHQHYVSPTCSPTRVALLTGRHPAHYRVYGPLGSESDVQPSDAHLPRTLQSLGYTTHISGKWHIGETPEHRPLRYGFSTSYGYLRGQIDPYTHRYKFGDYVTWHRNDKFVDECCHVTDLITAEAVRIIEEAGDAPFFLYVCHHSPHYPLNEPPKWIEPYEEIFDDVWRRHFAAAVTHLDDGVGQIIAALEETGQRDDTLVIFSSDNGGQQSWSAPKSQYNGRYGAHTALGDNRPLRGWKGELYEGGIRVPAIVNWPGRLEPGTRLETPTHMVDFAPTLIGLAGGEVDPQWKLEGQDLWPVLTGTGTLGPRQFYWNHGNRLRAVRDDRWKLILRPSGQAELFDIESDPYEKHELSQRYPQRVAELRKLCEKWSQHTSPPH